MIGIVMHYQHFRVSVILVMNTVAPDNLSLDIISLTSKYAVLHYLPLARVAKLKLVARYIMMNILLTLITCTSMYFCRSEATSCIVMCEGHIYTYEVESYFFMSVLLKLWVLMYISDPAISVTFTRFVFDSYD